MKNIALAYEYGDKKALRIIDVQSQACLATNNVKPGIKYILTWRSVRDIENEIDEHIINSITKTYSLPDKISNMAPICAYSDYELSGKVYDTLRLALEDNVCDFL